MILAPEDYIARLACALALDDLAEAKRVMADMSKRARHKDALARGRKAAFGLPEEDVAPMPLPWPGSTSVTTLWDVDPASRLDNRPRYASAKPARRR